MTVAEHAPEIPLLSDVLELPSARCALHSREPLRAGSVVGVEVEDPEAADPLLYYVDTSPLRVETGVLHGARRIPRCAGERLPVGAGRTVPSEN